jgi:hypothetical protein
MERLASPVRERPVNVAMPKIKTAQDAVEASAVIAEAVANGEIVPGEAAALSALVANTTKILETAELSDRLARLEEQLSVKGNNP